MKPAYPILPKKKKKNKKDNFGASLGHFQEKLNAKWTVTSLYRRQSLSGCYSADEGTEWTKEGKNHHILQENNYNSLNALEQYCQMIILGWSLLQLLQQEEQG